MRSGKPRGGTVNETAKLYVLEISLRPEISIEPVYYTPDVNEAKRMGYQFAEALYGNTFVVKQDTNEHLYLYPPNGNIGEWAVAIVRPLLTNSNDLFEMYLRAAKGGAR